ncbi:SLAP domain-containing protein [Brevibacillus dissolubilis]|uniref:SLAP domain-containing protein n=1 Tax=Brevibacillus dissolubilis TaxID=1844116 RepID=UPI001115E530|nr:SLAP domain-containing protein [Brevibacillus dissolubilis]
MFQFLKNWFRGKDTEELRSVDEIKQDLSQESVTSPEAEGDLTYVSAEEVKVKTALSLHPVWEQQLDTEKKYTLRFLQEDLPAMHEGTIGVIGFSLIPGEDGITVALFVRNATPNQLKIENVGLTIVLDGKPFARQKLNLSDVGNIPPMSSRPWEVFFPRETFLSDNFAFKSWKVMLNLGTKTTYIWPHNLDIDPAMEARMTDKQKAHLERLAHKLPGLKYNMTEITGFDIGKTKEGHLAIGLLIRNARDTVYSPEKLRIEVRDAHDDLIAKGSVDASKVVVKPGTTKPWLVVFPADIIKKPDASLDKWKLIATDK